MMCACEKARGQMASALQTAVLALELAKFEFQQLATSSQPSSLNGTIWAGLAETMQRAIDDAMRAVKK